LGRLSMKTGQAANLKMSLVDAETKAVVQLAGLSMTFLDLDEGKNGKGRVTVSACGEQFTPETTELSLSHDGKCSSATSSVKGSGADNPDSVEGGLVDAVASKRLVSYVFEPTDDGVISFTFGVTPGFGVRNFLFSLSPGAACINEGNMPQGCAADLEKEKLDITTTTPAPAEEQAPVDPTTTAAPEEEAFEYVVANGQNDCPEGSSDIADAAACEAAAPNIQWPGQRNGRWQNRGHSFGFMPYGCVLYTGWKSGQHEAIVLWNDNRNGRNDGNRAKVCAPFPAEEEEPEEAEVPAPVDFVIAQGQNTCPPGTSGIADAAACEGAAPSLQYGNQRSGRWENRGNNFNFMPYGCVLYTGWASGQHEAIVLWNNNINGKNDGNRAVVCQPGAADLEEEAALPVPYIGARENSCPTGQSPIPDAAACEAIAPRLKYGTQRHGRWENRGNNFGFMPPGCVLYIGWPSGMHEAIVLWNNNQGGINDGNRAIVCQAAGADDAVPAEPEADPEPYIGVGASSCPLGKSPIADAADCEAIAPRLKYGNQRNGRWQNRGNNFGFMPPGCVLYTGWASGQHEAIVLWNNNQNGRNDGNRAIVCQ